MNNKLITLEKQLKNNSVETTISQELYFFLVKERERINSIFYLVETQRAKALLRVLAGEIVSEQV